jgi:hypothetical protein
MKSASGSEKISAASADVSTTLMAVTIRPNDRGRVAGRAETESPDLGQEIAGAQFPLRLDSFLNDGEQLALLRPVMPFSSPTQTFNDFVRGILDRQVHRHKLQISSILEPL